MRYNEGTGLKKTGTGFGQSGEISLSGLIICDTIESDEIYNYKAIGSGKENSMELLKGQKMKLSDMTSSTQIELQVAAKMAKGEADITCFGVDEKEKLSDDRYFIFYNQTSSPEQAIVMKNSGAGVCFSIDLKKLPPFIKKLVITVAADDQTAMRDVESGRLSVAAAGQSLADFSFTGSQFQQEKAVILCELYEKGGIWRVSVVSSGFNGGLSALLKHFGGEEAAPAPVPVSKPAIKVPVNPAPVPEVIKAEPVSNKPVSLKKSGDSHKISLKKNNKEIHVNLNWNTGTVKKGLFGTRSSGIDLDLACMYRLKTGEMGVIQALGKSFGSAAQPPYIFLDQDDRTGASQNGENMWFKKPELIDFAIVFAYIYEGVANWKNTDASVVLKQQGSPDIEIHLNDAKSMERFCVIASFQARGEDLEVRREERFFKGHREVDQAYGFGFRWKAGSK